MGKVYSLLTRPIRMFNIENRAERVISREKPIPAPQYATTEKQRKLTEKVNPHFLEDHYQKNVQLDQRLKDVFVKSTDSQELTVPARESKPLPQNRHNWENEFIYEFSESAVIPAGKCSLKQALTFIFQHKCDPIAYSSETIASEYKIDKEVVDDILKYFKLYTTISTSDIQPIILDPMQGIVDQNIEAEKNKDMEKKK